MSDHIDIIGRALLGDKPTEWYATVYLADGGNGMDEYTYYPPDPLYLEEHLIHKETPTSPGLVRSEFVFRRPRRPDGPTTRECYEVFYEFLTKMYREPTAEKTIGRALLGQWAADFGAKFWLADREYSYLPPNEDAETHRIYALSWTPNGIDATLVFERPTASGVDWSREDVDRTYAVLYEFLEQRYG